MENKWWPAKNLSMGKSYSGVALLYRSKPYLTHWWWSLLSCCWNLTKPNCWPLPFNERDLIIDNSVIEFIRYCKHYCEQSWQWNFLDNLLKSLNQSLFKIWCYTFKCQCKLIERCSQILLQLYFRIRDKCNNVNVRLEWRFNYQCHKFYKKCL